MKTVLADEMLDLDFDFRRFPRLLTSIIPNRPWLVRSREVEKYAKDGTTTLATFGKRTDTDGRTPHPLPEAIWRSARAAAAHNSCKICVL